MKLLPSGDSAILLEVADLTAVMGLLAPVQALPNVVDVIPGERTILVTVAEPAQLAALKTALPSLVPAPVSHHPRTVEIPVTYDGADLAEVARQTGLTSGEVIEAHTGTPWRVGFGGFAPGFAYLVGGDPRLRVTRRTQPRAAVPAGAVALAGTYSAIYPRQSPGGWQLIGSTDVELFNPSANPPALLTPGITVKFVARHA